MAHINNNPKQTSNSIMKFRQKTTIHGDVYLVRIARNGAECEEMARAICEEVYTKSEAMYLKKCLDIYLDWTNHYITLDVMAEHYHMSKHKLKGIIATGESIWESVEWAN